MNPHNRQLSTFHILSFIIKRSIGGTLTDFEGDSMAKANDRAISINEITSIT